MLIKLLTVITDSRLSFADGKLLIRIWKATVTSEPDDPPIGFELDDAPCPPVDRPSGRMVKPEGRMGM